MFNINTESASSRTDQYFFRPEPPARIAEESPLSSVAQVQRFEHLLEAYHLVYNEYLRCGYIQKNEAELHFSRLQLAPVNQTFAAVDNSDKVVGTGSVVLKTGLGLPSSSVFGEELELIGRFGRRVAEATLLSCVDQPNIRANEISLQLIRVTLGWCVARDVSHYCVVVNPKHVRFWEDTLGFQMVGESKPCGHVRGAPGLLLVLNLDKLLHGDPHVTPVMQNEILSRWIPPEQFPCDYSLDPEEITELLMLRPDLRRATAERRPVATDLSSTI